MVTELSQALTLDEQAQLQERLMLLLASRVRYATQGDSSSVSQEYAQALLEGRDYVTPEDVQRMAEPVLAHRLVLSPEARMRNMTAERILANVMGAVQVPVKVK